MPIALTPANPPTPTPPKSTTGLPLDLLACVAYASPAEAQAAARALQGRQFADRRVETGFMPEGSALWEKLLALK